MSTDEKKTTHHHPETVTSISDKFLKKLRKSFPLLRKKDEVIAILKQTNKCIQTLRKVIGLKKKNDQDNISNILFPINDNILKLTNNLSLLKTCRKRLHLIKKEKLNIIGGGGLTTAAAAVGTTSKQQQAKQQYQNYVEWENLENCFRNSISSGIITNLTVKDPIVFLDKAQKCFLLQVRKKLHENHNCIKVNCTFTGEFAKKSGDIIETDLKSFTTRNEVIDATTNLKEWYETFVKDKILNRLSEFQERDSGWSLSEIISLKVIFNRCNPLNAAGTFSSSCSSTYTEVPKFIANRKAVINIRNNDEYCFLWCIVAALHPTDKNPQRITKYPHFSEVLKYEGIKFPFNVRDLKKFEKLNNLSINIFYVSNKQIYPLTIKKSNYEDDDDGNNKCINLLMLENVEGGCSHYVLIKNLNRLLFNQLSSNKNQKYVCERCLNYFSSKCVLIKHLNYCKNKKVCHIKVPSSSNQILQFKNFSHKIPVCFVIYADLECILEPIIYNDGKENKKNGGGGGGSIERYQKHIPHSIAYYLKCNYDDSLSQFKLIRDKNCIKLFIKDLHEIAITVNEILDRIVPMSELTVEQEIAHYNATTCHICEEPFNAVLDGEDNVCVKDHCHVTGTYRGAAHSQCNLQFQQSKVIPIVFHNLSGYDSHFIIEELATGIKGPISLLPINKEKYISFTKKIENTNISLRFIDSFRFMASSLDKLSSYLRAEEKTIMRSFYPHDNEFKLLLRKGVFPYAYIDSWEKLNETHLPTREAFFNELKNESISAEDYRHAENVWQTFNVHTLGEYSDIYLKTDVILLSDVFENFRKTCYRTYQLDPLHYFTSPGLSFDAMLKNTRIKLHLMQDIDMILFIELGIRGGYSAVIKSNAKANNKYMMEDYDPTQLDTYLIYIDKNALYSTTMCEYLPYQDFEWLKEDEYNGSISDGNNSGSDGSNSFNVLSIEDNAEYGYILEVDLHYPSHLHNLHKDFPLAPEHLTPPGSKHSKLMTTLYDKHNYVIHYRNLKNYLKRGMVLQKIHRILKFKQCAWMKTYVELNINLRKQSKNDFEKNFFKLMVNSAFGKTIENVRKYKDVKLVTSWWGRSGARALISKPNFHSLEIYDSNMVIIEMQRNEVEMNKPIYIGFTILDLSKLHMYNFHYDYILRQFDERSVDLCYTDTDSFIYLFKNIDFYEYIKRDCREYFDTSDYDEANIFNIPRVNRKELGMFKDENAGRIMLEFIGLRSKMYSFKMWGRGGSGGGEEIKRSKGVVGSTLKTITFDDYKNCLLNQREMARQQILLQSKKHVMYSIKQRKIVLNVGDDKRMSLHDSLDSLPWGFVEETVVAAAAVAPQLPHQ